MNKINFLALLLFGFSPIFSRYFQPQTVHLHRNGNDVPELIETLNAHNVRFDEPQELAPGSEDLHIICNVLDAAMLPQHYIAYQPKNLAQTKLTPQQKQRLSDAISVWDPRWDSIAQYRKEVHNFYCLPHKYEYADAVLLPCFLRTEALSSYKNILISSNTHDSEISSLTPLLFFHAYTKNPQFIVEAGVSVGNSSKVLDIVTRLVDADLLGIDISIAAAKTYEPFVRAEYKQMNDLNFQSYYCSSPYRQRKIDVLFIDTSHEYQHTLGELEQFLPAMADDGIVMFHDANVTPLHVEGREGWWRINNTYGKMNPLAPSNPRGVAPALKKYFSMEFDETKFQHQFFTHNNIQWEFIHYPFCNGLTVMKKQAKA